MTLISTIIVNKKNRNHTKENDYEINIEPVPINGKFMIHRIGKPVEYAIYKLTNKINNKVYIGATSVDPVARWQGGKGYRLNIPLSEDIEKYGWINFKKEIIAYSNNADDAFFSERYFISKYNSNDLNIGYNKSIGGETVGLKYDMETRKRMSESHTGLKETIETKRKKSNKIIAIKDNDLYICDSAKLFGDFVGSTKDYVKNCLRRPCKLKDYNVYYFSKEKRDDIINKKLQKPYSKGINHIDVSRYLDKYLNESTDIISDNKYNIKYLIYSDNVSGYEIVNEI